jgi:hypothetical protein
MMSRKIATVLGGITIGALVLTAAPAYADSGPGHGSASRNQAATRISGFNATPHRVHKGDRLFLHGTLRSQSGHGHLPGHQRVYVSFQPSGSHNSRRIDTIVTRSNGTFSTQARASQSGTWSVSVNNGRRGDSKASDYVAVVH